MQRTQKIKQASRLSLVILVVVLAALSAASARAIPGYPGKLCGSVSGASWKYQGQHGTRYNVTALPAKSCGAAMKAVSGLTRQKPHTGVLGPHTLAGPSGFKCMGSGVITPASAGFCGANSGAKFFWAPRLNN